MATMLTGACAILKPFAPPLATVEGVKGHFPIGKIIDLKEGKAIAFDEFIDQLRSRDLIFIGEVHDNPEHHLIQVQMLQALVARCGPVTIAMEFFQKPQQPVIDRYLQGKMTEEEFLREVNWPAQWGFPYHYYRPLIQIAKERGSRLLAINAPRDLVKKVARSGLKSLDPAERAQLAKRIDLTHKRHRAFLRKVYQEHPTGELKEFEYFYQAQCVWEDTMAENIAEYISKERQRVVVLAGDGHIANRFGIPDRTLARISVKMATVVLRPIDAPVTLHKGEADYVWLTADFSGNRRSMPNPERVHKAKYWGQKQRSEGDGER